MLVGKTGSHVCPVSAILEYIELRGSQAGLGLIEEASPEPWFVAQLCEVFCRIGFPPMDCAGQSFRIGAATTASLVA